MSVWGLAACGTIERPDPVPLGVLEARLAFAADPRVRPGDENQLQAVNKDFAVALGYTGSRGNILAMSGGGANGAYGAGVLVGWSQSGTRPRFDIVTGISTGALAAPFAYLGSDWDDELQSAYVSGRAVGILHARGLTDFAATSLFSPDKLRQLVDDSVTPELLRAIAVEHARGRRLLVVTTNLDSAESVIWDMGKLATQGDEQALILFRQVLVASASIPGLFPPVMISGLIDGQRVEEMHVDGGVNMPFLALPEAMLGGNERVSGVATAPDRAAIYVLVNGQVRRDHQVVRGYLPDILLRAYDSMSKAALRTHLVANATFAQRNGLAFRVAAIPGDHTFSSLDFAQASMQSLFELGRFNAATGQAWKALNAGATMAAFARDAAEDVEAQAEVDEPRP
jgi:hypothetical protein